MKIAKAGRHMTFQRTIAPGTIQSGLTVTYEYEVAGARLGDVVNASIEQDLQGCLLSGYVDAVDSVIISITNLTGCEKTFEPGRINIAVESFTTP